MGFKSKKLAALILFLDCPPQKFRPRWQNDEKTDFSFFGFFSA
jgi:hypothetical protein